MSYAHLANVPAARHTLTQLRRAGGKPRPKMSQADALTALDAAAERQREPDASDDDHPCSLAEIAATAQRLAHEADIAARRRPPGPERRADPGLRPVEP